MFDNRLVMAKMYANDNKICQNYSNYEKKVKKVMVIVITTVIMTCIYIYIQLLIIIQYNIILSNGLIVC